MKAKLTILGVVVIAGAGIAFGLMNKEMAPGKACTQEAMLCPDGSAVGRTGPNCEFAACPGVIIEQGDAKEFGQSFSMQVGETAKFSDGLTFQLKEINDSRCPAGVQCIWAGELSALLMPIDVRIGTTNNKSVVSNGYRFTLESATPTSITITVSKSSVAVGTGTLNGYVHVGPVCPVERMPPDPNCADRPYADGQVYIQRGGVNLDIHPVTDSQGRFQANLPPGSYSIGVKAPLGRPLPSCEEVSVEVKAGESISVDISCDSGIR